MCSGPVAALQSPVHTCPGSHEALLQPSASLPSSGRCSRSVQLSHYGYHQEARSEGLPPSFPRRPTMPFPTHRCPAQDSQIPTDS